MEEDQLNVKQFPSVSRNPQQLLANVSRDEKDLHWVMIIGCRDLPGQEASQPVVYCTKYDTQHLANAQLIIQDVALKALNGLLEETEEEDEPKP